MPKPTKSQGERTTEVPENVTDELRDLMRSWLEPRLVETVATGIQAAFRTTALEPLRGGCIFLPLWFPPGESVSTAEDLAGAAGTAVAEMEDSSRRLVKNANKIPGDSKAAGDKARDQVRADAEKELKNARAAKNKVAGAAAAAKKFKDAKKSIKDAEKSFDDAEDLLDDYDANLPTTADNFAKQNKRLQDAAKNIKDDVEKLKEALSAISE